jgi:hypothetical protein
MGNPHEQLSRNSMEQQQVSEEFARADTIEREKRSHYEVYPTEREFSIIADAFAAVDSVISRYGQKAQAFSREQIHIVQPGAVEEITKGKFATAYHNWLISQITVDRQSTEIGLAVVIAHEMFHGNGPKTPEGKVPSPLWRMVEEGIVSRLEFQAYQTLRNNPDYQKEIEATDRIKPWMSKLMERAGMETSVRAQILDNLYAFPLKDAQNIIRCFESGQTEEYKLGYLSGSLKRLLQEDKLAVRGRVDEMKIFNSFLEDKGGKARNRDEAIRDVIRAYLAKDITKLRQFVYPTTSPVF